MTKHEVAPKYQVLSDNFADKEPGEIVTADELEGCNIPALIEAGHIAALTQSEAVEATNIKEQ